MRKLLLSFCLTLSLLGALPVNAELCVIVHPENPLQALTSSQVSDFYLGRVRVFDNDVLANGSSAKIFDHPDASPLRASFFRSLNAMSLERVTAYWARLRFSGQILPPESLPDSRAIIAAVSKNPLAIGYVDADAISGAPVKVVLRLKN